MSKFDNSEMDSIAREFNQQIKQKENFLLKQPLFTLQKNQDTGKFDWVLNSEVHEQTKMMNISLNKKKSFKEPIPKNIRGVIYSFMETPQLARLLISLSRQEMEQFMGYNIDNKSYKVFKISLK